MDHGTKKPNLGGTYGNANQLGVIANKAGSSLPRHPGTVTRGPGSNKPRIHLVSSKGKIPAEVVAQAFKMRQASPTGPKGHFHATGGHSDHRYTKRDPATKAVNPTGAHGSQTDPNLRGAHVSQPAGVKPYPVKPKTGLT
jgi:hypothetical protein